MIPIIPTAALSVSTAALATTTANLATTNLLLAGSRSRYKHPAEDVSVHAADENLPPPQRSYTVDEIQQLRYQCENIWLYGPGPQIGMSRMSRSYQTHEKDIGVEQLLRTYMMAGITAEDIRKENLRIAALRLKAMRPEQMKMARRFCEHHRGKMTIKAIYRVYRGYLMGYYGHHGTPLIGEDGNVNGGSSGCPYYVLGRPEPKPEQGPPTPTTPPPSKAMKEAKSIEDKIVDYVFATLVLFALVMIAIVATH